MRIQSRLRRIEQRRVEQVELVAQKPVLSEAGSIDCLGTRFPAPHLFQVVGDASHRHVEFRDLKIAERHFPALEQELAALGESEGIQTDTMGDPVV